MAFVKTNVQVLKDMADNINEKVKTHVVLLQQLEHEKEDLETSLEELAKAKERAVNENDILEDRLRHFKVKFRDHLKLK